MVCECVKQRHYKCYRYSWLQNIKSDRYLFTSQSNKCEYLISIFKANSMNHSQFYTVLY